MIFPSCTPDMHASCHVQQPEQLGLNHGATLADVGELVCANTDSPLQQPE
jgi:hypothetical protein